MAKPLSTTEVILGHEAATARRAVVAAKQVQATKVPHSTRKCYTEEELARLKAQGK
jgi:hypothetical protein